VEGSARERLGDVSSFLQIPSQVHVHQLRLWHNWADSTAAFETFGRRYRLAQSLLKLEADSSSSSASLASSHDGRISYRPTKASQIWPRNRHLSFNLSTNLPPHSNSNAPPITPPFIYICDHYYGATKTPPTTRSLNRTSTPQDPHADSTTAGGLVHGGDTANIVHGACGREEV
jgi:hypothetical protein